MSSDTFSYSVSGDIRSFSGNFNGSPLQPGASASVRNGQNRFTWDVRGEPGIAYKIKIDKPVDQARTINLKITDEGDDNGILRFRRS